MLNLAKSLFQAGASEGYGEEDLSAVVNAMRPGSARRSANNSSNNKQAVLNLIMAPSCWFSVHPDQEEGAIFGHSIISLGKKLFAFHFRLLCKGGITT